MPRPPLAQPLFFFSLLLVLGGAAGAVGSFWWTARWHERDEGSGTAARTSRTLATDSRWENRPGWQWLIEPRKPGGPVGTGAGILTFSAAESGLEVSLACAEEPGGETSHWRFAATAFDGSGNVLGSAEAAENLSSGGVVLRQFRLHPPDVSRQDVTHVGIEVLTGDPR